MGLEPKKQGRPQYQPTDADRVFVDRAVMGGSRINDIAAALKITDDTLRKHFKYEILTGRERLKGDAVRVVMDSLADGSLDAAKFVLARVAGWSEKTVHSGDGENPIHIKVGARDELVELIEQATRLGVDPALLGLIGSAQEGDDA